MTAIQGIRLGEDDLAVLTACGRYGVLASEDALDYYGGRKKNTVLKRLRLLSENQLIRSIKLQVWWASDQSTTKSRKKGGRIPTLYALTPTGAEIVESHLGQNALRVLRSEPSPATFLHRHSIARVMRAFDLSCGEAELTVPEWVMEQDIGVDPNPNLPPNQRRLLYHDFGNGLTCSPDIASRLQIGENELAMFWEIDLSSEGKKQLRRASKTAGYVQLMNERAYQRYWPDLSTNLVFVLWVATSKQRIKTLQEVLRESPIAPFCRFLLLQAVEQRFNLLTEKVWLTIDNEPRAMYRPRD